jgi:hypothetical protein
MMIVDRSAAHCANSDQRQAVPARDEHGPPGSAAFSCAFRPSESLRERDRSSAVDGRRSTASDRPREMTASLREATVGTGTPPARFSASCICTAMSLLALCRRLSKSGRLWFRVDPAAADTPADAERRACAFAQEQARRTVCADFCVATIAITRSPSTTSLQKVRSVVRLDRRARRETSGPSKHGEVHPQELRI